ncbi:unnamed protein product [Echinostoma caproni]|uniref:ubiquitinyl hydrolase 1 n=1 Tax=Echinostoma caproni TaxID=27848 RepID=A0A183B6M5_9TREM|nr:unnamed protein product [Echinostoma caproni]
MLIGTAENLPQMQIADTVVEEKPQVEDKIELPHGLVNLGNTCYANAAVQMLYSVPEVCAALEM